MEKIIDNFKSKNGRDPSESEMIPLRIEGDLYANQILAQPQEGEEDGDEEGGEDRLDEDEEAEDGDDREEQEEEEEEDEEGDEDNVDEQQGVKSFQENGDWKTVLAYFRTFFWSFEISP